MRILLEPAFVLHATLYRETSLLVNFFTQNYGKVAVIARGARSKRSAFKGNLSPFSPLLISLSGKGELMQLNAAELEGTPYFLQGHNLFNGLYLNELLIKLAQRFDPYPHLFCCYREAITQLQNKDLEPQKILRLFEKQLLAELGYGLRLSHEASGKEVMPDVFYVYHVDQGVMACAQQVEGAMVFLGRHLLAIEHNNLDTIEILHAAKRLMRIALRALLGHYSLKTRELFIT